MAKEKIYIVGDRSISSGHEVHGPGKVVTSKIMGVSQEIFDGLVKKGRVKEKTEAATKTPPPGESKQDVIVKAIGSLYNDKGEPINTADFTADGKPQVTALHALLENTAGFEDGITAAERDEAWAAFLRTAEAGN